MRAVAIKHDLPFWNIILTAPHGNYRELTQADLRLQMYGSLIYGAKGISFYKFTSASLPIPKAPGRQRNIGNRTEFFSERLRSNNARGSVNLNGLALKTSLNFASDPSNEFTLIKNDGSDVVVGTFTGLPQNKKLYVGSELFRINYAGGTGNDVVLSRLPTPLPPLLSIERVSPTAVRLLWPTNDPFFRLEFKTNLNISAWSPITSPPVSGTNHVVTNTVSAAQRFYRLASP